jgi:hypothetical protein
MNVSEHRKQELRGSKEFLKNRLALQPTPSPALPARGKEPNGFFGGRDWLAYEDATPPFQGTADA